MTNKAKGYILLGSAALYWWVLRGVNALVFRFVQLRMTGIDIAADTIQLRATFLFRNPLLISIYLKYIQGEIYIMNQLAAQIDSNILRTLPSRNFAYVDVPISVSISGLGAGVYENIRSGNIRTLLVDFSGKIGVGKDKTAGIPVQVTLTWDDIVNGR